MLRYCGLKLFVTILLVCKDILSQPTVFTKHWYKGTNCITDENDILTTMEFILVDLQRLRFDTKQLKDDSASMKIYFAKMKEDIGHMKTQNKKVVLAMNKFESKLRGVEIANEGFKTVLLEINKTMAGIFSFHIYESPETVSKQAYNTSAKINAENELSNEITVKIDTADLSNDKFYFDNKENEVEKYDLDVDENSNDIFQVVDGKHLSVDDENDEILHADIENDNDVEIFSGERENAGSGFLEERSKKDLDVPDLESMTLTDSSITIVPAEGKTFSNPLAEKGDTGILKDDSENSSKTSGSEIAELKTTDEETGQVFTGCSAIPATESGIFIISPPGTDEMFPVYCQFEDNGHWLIFQRRLSGEVDFYRNWTDYKNGFGNLDGEFWLGNEKLHLITTQNKYMLRIDMWDWNPREDGTGLGNHFFAESRYFYVDNETEFYRLHVPNGFYDYGGFGGSGLRVHAGPFMTYDKLPPDIRTNCAQLFHTGWWFKTCVRNANLNGKYYNGGYAVPENRKHARDGIFWRNIPRSLKKVEMKLKRVGP